MDEYSEVLLKVCSNTCCINSS